MKTIIRGVFVVAAAITSACFWPVLAQAADAPGADAAATDTLAEVIVTATRREQNLNEVPFSTTALAGATSPW